MLKKFTLIFVLFSLLGFSCSDLLNNVNVPDSLTKEQVIEGLKTALKVGTDTTTVSLHQTDSYFRDALIKILLPKDAQNVLDFAMNNSYVQALGIDVLLKNQIDEVVLRMNRTAEDAAQEAKPIFSDAILNLSIDQAWDILNGSNPLDSTDTKRTEVFDSAAATHYLYSATFRQLKTAYKPKIDNALSKELVAGISTKDAWKKLTDLYNPVASTLGQKELDPSLSTFVTERALDGLFLKVAGIERDIRKNPVVWALQTAQDILEKVFGSQSTGNSGK